MSLILLYLFIFVFSGRECRCLSKILWLQRRMWLLPAEVQRRMSPPLSRWEVERKFVIPSVSCISCKCVGSDWVKFWSKLPWCSERWDKLLDERNHVQGRILWEKGNLFIYRKIKEPLHELELHIFSWVICRG